MNDARYEESGVAEAGLPGPLCHRTPGRFAYGFGLNLNSAMDHGVQVNARPGSSGSKLN